MNFTDQQRALRAAVQAAHAAGQLMSRNSRLPKKIEAASQHDIKLELDVRCQKRIESILRRAFPTLPILGEEGVLGDPQAPCRWVIDPIDGTVNFTYGIPHACVSIALQQRLRRPAARRPVRPPQWTRCNDLHKTPAGDGHETPQDHYQTLAGVIHDPFCRETFTALRGQRARLNGRPITVSPRRRLQEAVVSIGFAKTRESLEAMLPAFGRLTHRVRKIRIMGAAALALAYVASGRMDAYVERGVRLWDIAAGGLLVECAGGDFRRWPLPGPPHSFALLASNGLLRGPIEKVL